MANNEILINKITCLICSQDNKKTIDDLKPMVEIQTSGKTEMLCTVCNTVHTPPQRN